MPPRPPRPFAARVVRWQAAHGRHGLPWQGTRDAYRIWLSEVMLQQTQVTAAAPYFERFVARFPDAGSLAAADLGEVLALWSGLGYYARARNLHRAAQEVASRFGGRFPTAAADLETLPGVGRSTAAAIAAFSSGERRAILDGNVKRVIARHAGIGGDPSTSPVLAALWSAAEARLPDAGIEAYTQGMMDLGATVCLARSPRCDACPVSADCSALREGRIAELPGRKKKAPPPRRATGMLVQVHRGEVLLEKRPAEGIWGGLWSLPEFPADAPPAGAISLPVFEHAFTHFTLEVHPFHVMGELGVRPLIPLGPASASETGISGLTPDSGNRCSDPIIWLSLQDVEGAALPAPVKRLLLQVRAASAAAGTCAGSPAAPKRRAAPGASASRPVAGAGSRRGGS